MIKRFLSLLCVLALCLGLLPVTALAADGIELYVGGQRITESGCYEKNQNGKWTKVEGTGPSSGQFSYDAATFTLTLNQAEITNNQTVNVAEGYTYDGSVIAFSQTADVSLNIVVSQGTSTITGKGGIRVESTTGNASLSIKGSGSLDVEPKGSNSGITLCSSKNTNLDIDGADVTASSPALYGVYLISSTDASSTSTITVNNGSLTTGGNGNVGIYYYWSGTSNAGTSSLTVSGNAVVDTRNSQIMAQNKETVVQVGAGSDGNGGIVFNGKSGTVYGKVELQDDIEIKSDETLKIPDGSSLNCNDKLTNNGTINVESGGKLEGTPKDNGTITIAPTITTKTLPNGTVYTLYNQTLEATGDTPITWSLASGSTLPNGLTLNSNGTISGTPTAVGKSTFTITATNGNGSDRKEFTLSINEETKYSLTVNLNGGNGTTRGGQYTKGTKIQIDAGTKSGYRFAGWTSSKGGSFADASSARTTFTMPANDTTITANWKKKSSGGSVFFWDLKFDTNGGSKIDTVTEWEYSTIDLDEYVPEKEGYKFVGWYADEDLTKEIDEVYLTQDTTVYAKWEKIEEEVPEEPEEVEETETISFLDVKESDWFYEAVSYAVENGLMSGMSEDIFAPNTPLTREMLAVILWNLEGNPTPNDVTPFLDVTSDKYYANAIAWANENGIVAGYGDTFGVGDFITREQFAVMLYNYAQYQGYDVSVGEDTNILSYTDAFDISNYAYPAMQWACGAGIMSGNDDGTLNPQGKATRAEAATMLMNFCENVVK